jgi:menaquinone-dependent protoporphyrinogen IX oxidase
MKYLFGWELSSYSSYRKSRNRPKRETLDPAIIAAVQERNRFDRALYEFGKKMFEDLTARTSIDFEKEAATFRAGGQNRKLAAARNLASSAWRAAASRVVSLL